MTKILIAGATGYLGSYVAEECARQGYYLKVLVRNFEKLKQAGIHVNEIITAELTDKKTLARCCNDVDIVFSSVGITRQKEGLTYMDVDYQANLNLLEDAKQNGVKKFVYVSVFNGENLRRLKICEAKEKFVDALKESGLDFCVIRPTGYFSDMREFFTMAENGRVFLFGKGNHKMNPIDGKDLAKVCVDAMMDDKPEINLGGPEVLSHEEIAETAFSVAEKKKRITHIPNWIIKIILSVLRTFTSSKFYGPIEFFITVLSMDLIAPKYGNHTLKKYFEELKTKQVII